MAATPPPDVPLRIGTAEAFAQARRFCRDAGYDDDAALCRALSIKELHEADNLDWEKVDLTALPGALRWCIDVFFRGRPAPEDESRTICGDTTLAAFLALGLLAPARDRPATVICPVWLYPVDGFLIVSDRCDDAA